MIVVHQLVLQPWLTRLTSDAPVINIAGRQRMLSQKLAKASLALLSASDSKTQAERRAELAVTLNEWRTAHRALQTGSITTPVAPSLEVQRLFSRLSPAFDAMADSAKMLAAEYSHQLSDDNRRAAVETILAYESDYLDLMHSIVGLYEAGARQRALQVQYAGLALMSCVLLVLILLVIDISGRKLAEQRNRELIKQLTHADRLRSMGEMAAGLAHELNQPLGAIANYAEGCLAQLAVSPPSPSDWEPPLRGILRAALRGGEIVRRTCHFAKRHPHRIALESVNDLAQEIVNLCSLEADRRGVTLKLKLCADSPRVLADGIQIQQALANLIQNAFAALECIDPQRRHILVSVESNDDGVQVAVEDSGCGMPDGPLDHLFEPFVTTRAEGTGLGLTIVKGIVEAHGGSICVQRSPEGGALFRFFLPLKPPSIEETSTNVIEETAYA